MATDKKHIAVYLAPEVEQALIAFCEQRGFISKKGTMFSAGVNAALAEFFGVSITEASNIPSKSSNILNNSGNIPVDLSTIPAEVVSNILTESVVVEVSPGKLESGDSLELPKVDNEVVEQLQNELGNLKDENEKLRADYAALLESSTHVTNKLRQEAEELRMQLGTAQAELFDAKQIITSLEPSSVVSALRLEIREMQTENEKLKTEQPSTEFELLEASDLLNRLKAKRKKSTASLADVEALLKMMGK